MNRLVVRYQYTSRCENLYCVAIVGHKWLFVIGLCLRIQNLYTHYQCRFNTSHCKNCYPNHCVAIVAHGWFLRIRDTFGGSSNGWNVQRVNVYRLDHIMMMST